MPVRVRCPECAMEISAPEKARGKAIKCPDCQSRVKVPANGAPQKKKKRKRRPVPDGDDILSSLDLREAEDNRTKICPKCATTIRDDEIEECPACGVNIFTGRLSERQKKKRSNAGPDPEDFFKNVWKNSKNFVKKNRGLAIRTAINWTVYLTLALTSLLTSQWSYHREVIGMIDDSDNQGVTFTANATIIEGDGDNKAVFRGKSYRRPVTMAHPRVLAQYSPSVNFWRFLAVVFGLGFGGWSIYLTTEIVKATMRGEKLNRIQPDFFGNITAGFKAYVWPWFVLMPLPAIAIGIFGAIVAMSGVSGTLSQTQQIVAGCCVGVIYLLSLFLLPPAAVHWAQNHTYPAWLFTRMAAAFARTIKPAIVLSLAIFTLCILPPLGLAGGVAAGWSHVANFWKKTVLAQVSGVIGMGSGDGFFDFTVVELPLFMLVVGTCLFLLFIITAFPTVMMMRALGLYGLYFRNDIGLVGETTAFQPCGFGPRYLAYSVDMFIVGIVVAILAAIQVPAAGFHPIYGAVIGLAQFLFIAIYFISSEIGQARATPGKWSLGIMVMQANNKPLDRPLGIRRFLFSFVSLLSLYGGFLMCLFTPDKSALHDRLSGTKVCWKGDDNRS